MHWEQAHTTVLYRERAAYLQWDTDRSVADPRGAELGDGGDGAIDTVTARKNERRKYFASRNGLCKLFR